MPQDNSAAEELDALDTYIDDDNIPLLRCLLEHAADPSRVDLQFVRSGEVLRLLVEFDYDIKSQGHLILHDFLEDRATLDWLLDQGVDINRSNTRQLDSGFNLAPGEYDYSLKVLNIASERGDIELFDHLVPRGADPSKSLALHSASRCQDETTAMLSHLLDEYKMDIHSDTDTLRDFFHQEQDTGTPLCSAICHKNLAAVKELLRRGADPTRYGAHGYHPMVKAIGDAFNPGFLPALRPLLETGVDPTAALVSAVRQLNVEAARICLQAGGDPESALEMALEHEKARSEGPVALEFYGYAKFSDEQARQLSHAMIELLQGGLEH